MIPYSAFFFLIDSLVVWRVVSWFNARVSVREHPADPRQRLHPLDPERAGRQGRDGALPEPARRRAGLAGRLEHALHHVLRVLLPAQLGDARHAVLVGARCRRVFHRSRGSRSARSSSSRSGCCTSAARSRPARRCATARSSTPSARRARGSTSCVILLRSPALLVAVFVYTHALRLFGVDAELRARCSATCRSSSSAPRCRARCARSPSRCGRCSSRTTPAQMTAFGLVQHNFFIFFNAAIGLCFLRRANRELFAQA